MKYSDRHLRDFEFHIDEKYMLPTKKESEHIERIGIQVYSIFFQNCSGLSLFKMKKLVEWKFVLMLTFQKHKCLRGSMEYFMFRN